MPAFMVAMDHMTSDTVQAKAEVTAIDRVLEGQGGRNFSETRDYRRDPARRREE